MSGHNMLGRPVSTALTGLSSLPFLVIWVVVEIGGERDGQIATAP